ncbi:hypothetical protein [Streptomyces inhibens]|uniref:hypothetical protein n=1 Tax=Streptomyces inhibens TaxID=2293571 RepID=UPI001EE73D3A|nr:hypothetical protein [Streptomyces inhibens]UKY48735.1 hypothetical protein KI385_07940 [Streptomyces inhibens]
MTISLIKDAESVAEIDAILSDGGSDLVRRGPRSSAAVRTGGRPDLTGRRGRLCGRRNHG